MNIDLRDLALLYDREKEGHRRAVNAYAKAETEENYLAMLVAFGRRELAYQLYIGVLFRRPALNTDEAVTG